VRVGTRQRERAPAQRARAGEEIEEEFLDGMDAANLVAAAR